MPIIKANQPLPERQPVIVIYGEPGVSKTSIVNTCEDVLLLDFDRGVDRSLYRKDTLQASTWADVLAEEAANTFRSYKTIGIDTAKAALDDFLMNHVIDVDPKLRANKLGMYGAIGDAFKIFINNRRGENAAIVIIAHAKKDEDTKKIIPDVTGQSYQLLMRIADQVCYVSIKNGKRTLSFDPSDYTVGKNVACLPEMNIPDKSTEEFKTFGKTLVDTVREAIAAMSEEQREALEKSAQYQEEISKCSLAELPDLFTVVNELPDYLKLPLIKLIGDKYADALRGCEDVERFNSLFTMVNELPDYLKTPLRLVVKETAGKRNWLANAETKKFEPADKEASDSGNAAPTTPAQAETKESKSATGRKKNQNATATV